MSKIDSLVVLVNSLTKSEKKALLMEANHQHGDKDYIYLFKLIDKEGISDSEELKEEYSKHCNGNSFSQTINYLNTQILEMLVRIRTQNDEHMQLMHKIMQANVLYEKQMIDESLEMLAKVKRDSKQWENFHMLHLAQRIELNYLLTQGFEKINEQQLMNKQFKLNESIKMMRRLNEQSALYELLRYRMDHKGVVNNSQHQQRLNDLVVSEMSIVASFGVENFEIKKMHQLFQSHYLISVGDYRSALHSFEELNTLFEENSRFWEKTPMYYLLTLEGILESLRSIGKYDGMRYFIKKLEELKLSYSSLALEIDALVFLYSLLPDFDRGMIKESCQCITAFKTLIGERIYQLSPIRRAQLLFYCSFAAYYEEDYTAARKMLGKVITTDSLYELPLYKAIRLLNLMIFSQQGDIEYVESQVRSIRRLNRNNGKEFKTENLMLKFLSKGLLRTTPEQKSKIYKKWHAELCKIRTDRYEMQLLRIFDFTQWIERKLQSGGKVVISR